jgi:DNA helicase MCM9
LEAGALVLADRGVCCIDEFNSMRESDKTSLHEAMEQQTISVAKAGLVCQLQTRCSIIASTNPKGKYDPYKEAEINIGISSPLLSRFDLIFILMDTQNLDRDESVSSFLLNAELQGPKKGDHDTLMWDLQKLQQYIQYTKLKFEPDISEEANQVLTAYYQFCRNSDGLTGPRTTIRLFEGLIRLTQSHARLIFRTSAKVEDAVTAIFIMEHSIHRRMLHDSWNIFDDFPSDPTEDYYRNGNKILLKTEDFILSKLNLTDLSTRNSTEATFENRKVVNSQPAQNDADLEKHEADQNQADDESVVSWEPSQQIQSTKRPNSVTPERSSPPRKFHATIDADDDLFIADLDFLD